MLLHMLNDLAEAMKALDGKNVWYELRSLSLPSGLYDARTGCILEQLGLSQDIRPLPGIYFFDGWQVLPTLNIPSNLPSLQSSHPRMQVPPSHGQPTWLPTSAEHDAAKLHVQRTETDRYQPSRLFHYQRF